MMTVPVNRIAAVLCGVLVRMQASLLCKATYEGKMDRLTLLLRAGCDPDAHDYGETCRLVEEYMLLHPPFSHSTVVETFPFLGGCDPDAHRCDDYSERGWMLQAVAALLHPFRLCNCQ
jgi:hypothetical protein